MRVFVKVLTVKNGEGEPIRDARWPKCFQICLYFFGNLDCFSIIDINKVCGNPEVCKNKNQVGNGQSSGLR